jgi:hypothetical protein
MNSCVPRLANEYRRDALGIMDLLPPEVMAHRG